MMRDAGAREVVTVLSADAYGPMPVRSTLHFHRNPGSRAIVVL